MSEDLIKRLRALQPQSYGPAGLHALIGEAIGEIERLQDAKRRALQVADERAKDAVDLRSQLASKQWQPIGTAPKNAIEIILLIPRRGKGWPTMRAVIGHWADGGGEEQPRFRGWFYDTGYDYAQLEDPTHWLPLDPQIPERIRALTDDTGKS